MTRNRNGFTVVEVIIAIVILSVGIISLAGTAALVTRMVAQGQRYTEAAQLANRRFEILRSMDCATLEAGSATGGQFTETWTITTVGTNGRTLSVVVQSPTGTGVRADTFSTTRFC
ncbi:MAG: prepilin-type N-terminal cleavage/methylation domain-containing protein [Gemmatimonadales bacterium]